MTSLSDLIELTEASLSRIYGHWKDRGFLILSADRGERTPEENEAWRTRLKAAIRAAGYGFVPLDGLWHETNKDTGERIKRSERAFLVPVRDGDVTALRRLGVKWGRLDPSNPQELVILASPEGGAEFVNPANGKVEFKLDKFVPGKVADIYSRLRRKPGTFVFESWQFIAPPTSFGEAYRRRHEGELTFYTR